MTDQVQRRKVGEADPETRRRMLNEALRSGPPVKKATAKPVADTSASAVDAARDLHRRGRQIDLAVDDPEETKRRQRQIEAMRGNFKK
jgi:hypothetical protein